MAEFKNRGSCLESGVTTFGIKTIDYLALERQDFEIVGSMQIPDNAIDLIDDTLKKAKSLMSECCSVLALDAEWAAPETILDECYYMIKLFVIRLNYFPHRWAGYDVLNWAVNVRDYIFDCYFEFSLLDVPPESQKTELREIPYELFLMFERMEVPENDEKDKGKFINEGWQLCIHVIRSLELLKNVIQMREKVLGNQSEQTHSEDANINHQGEKSEKPALIDQGRLIRCPKGAFEFTPHQAPIIKIYFENYKSSNEFLSEQSALEMADEMFKLRNPDIDPGYSRSSFSSIFKSRRDSFKTLFEQNTKQKDLYRLRLE